MNISVNLLDIYVNNFKVQKDSLLDWLRFELSMKMLMNVDKFKAHTTILLKSELPCSLCFCLLDAFLCITFI